MRHTMTPMLLLAACSLSAQAQAPTRPGGRAIVSVRCEVGAGPSLLHCVIPDPRGLDPARQGDLLAYYESTPSCLLTAAQMGTTLTLPFLYPSDDPDVSQSLASHGAPYVKAPVWAERPSASAIERAYPRHAAVGRISGFAYIACKVSIQGEARACEVLAESPPGEGFGAAAVRLAGEFRFKPKMVGCNPVDGGDIRVPLRFIPRS